MTDAPEGPEVVLARPLEVASMPLLAADLVADAPAAVRASLDYTPPSLLSVDSIIGVFAANRGTLDELAETLVCLGAYVGEVLVRHAGGVWVDTQADGEPALAEAVPLPMLVRVGTAYWNPIGTCFDRLGDPTSSAAGLLRAVTSRG